MASTEGTGIQCLPPEILILIFTLYVESFHSRGRTTAALVCQKWGKVCYETPSLWTRIHHEEGSRNSLALIKSKQCPLDITFDLAVFDYPDRKEVNLASFKEAYKDIHRWRTAHLVFPPDMNPADFLETRAPLLEAITIFKEGHPMTKPLNLFQEDAPRLRHLDVSRLSIPWGSRILSGLQFLKLELQSIPLEQCPTLTQIIDALASSPQLETLILYNITFPQPHSPPNVVKLPHLSELQLMYLSPDACAVLLRGINAPHCHSFRLVCNTPSDYNPRLLLPHITSFLQPASSGTLNLILADDLVKCELRCASPVIFALSLRGPPAIQVLGPLAAALKGSLLDLGTKLTTRLRGRATSPEITDLLRQAEPFRLTSMDVQASTSERVFRFLGQPEVAEGTQQWCFPHLRDLIVRYDGGSFEPLKQMVKARQDGGGAYDEAGPALFTSIRIQGSVDVSDAERKALEESVGTCQVTWDLEDDF